MVMLSGGGGEILCFLQINVVITFFVQNLEIKHGVLTAHGSDEGGYGGSYRVADVRGTSCTTGRRDRARYITAASQL